MAVPPYLLPFVLSVSGAHRSSKGDLDVYRPSEAGTGRRPVVVLVHGGPLPAELRPTPRSWPVYVGYGSLAASSGLVAVTFDHRLYDVSAYPTAATDVAAAVEAARGLPGVDPDRVALWFFSGGGLLMADWLREDPPWLRCIAASYPYLAPPPGWEVDPRFRPVSAVAAGGSVPLLLTRVGRERADVATAMDDFVLAAGATDREMTMIDVPEGQHGFDMLDLTDGSRDAVRQAMAWVVHRLGDPVTA